MQVIPGRPEVATGLPLIGTGFTLQNIEVVKSVTLLVHLIQAYSHFMRTASSVLDHKRSVNRVVQKGVKGVYTAMVKDPFRKWDRVYTVCALLVDLGYYLKSSFYPICEHVLQSNCDRQESLDFFLTCEIEF